MNAIDNRFRRKVERLVMIPHDRLSAGELRDLIDWYEAERDRHGPRSLSGRHYANLAEDLRQRLTELVQAN